jgi:hypothetical protein
LNGTQIENIKLLVLLGSQPGLEKVAAECPGLEIFVGGVDEQVGSPDPLLLFFLYLPVSSQPRLAPTLRPSPELSYFLGRTSS